jgi:uncharacterized protein Usg
MARMEDRLKGYRLATAEIVYHLPDHPSLLQTFVWQEYDQLPQFPVLKGFLQFWQKNLDGKIYHVTIASVDTISEGELHYLQQAWRLH